MTHKTDTITQFMHQNYTSSNIYDFCHQHHFISSRLLNIYALFICLVEAFFMLAFLLTHKKT